eukprot:1966383-Rhodomonas_salina.3
MGVGEESGGKCRAERGVLHAIAVASQRECRAERGVRSSSRGAWTRLPARLASSTTSCSPTTGLASATTSDCPPTGYGRARSTTGAR